MAAGITATFKMTSDLPRIAAGMEAKAEAIVGKVALDLEAGMKGRAPVDTGTLKNSIQAVKLGPAHWRIVVGVDYGMHVEWGTARQSAQPFVSPTVQEVRPVFLAAMKRVTA